MNETNEKLKEYRRKRNFKKTTERKNKEVLEMGKIKIFGYEALRRWATQKLSTAYNIFIFEEYLKLIEDAYKRYCESKKKIIEVEK